MPDPMIIDLHLDLAWDALFWNRDLTLTAHEVREQETSGPPQVAEGYNCGLCTTTFPELRRGRVGIILSTIMSRIQPPRGENEGRHEDPGAEHRHGTRSPGLLPGDGPPG